MCFIIEMEYLDCMLLDMWSSRRRPDRRKKRVVGGGGESWTDNLARPGKRWRCGSMGATEITAVWSEAGTYETTTRAERGNRRCFCVRGHA